MLHRREAMIRMGGSALLTGLLGGERPGRTQDADARQPSQLPDISQPILFNTPEADRIVAAIQVFPSNNPWNVDISGWPLHPNSRRIIASIGADKCFRYNPDYNFILVPGDQRRVRVKIGYPAESDRGPFPIPDNMPIEGWPGPKDPQQGPNATRRAGAKYSVTRSASAEIVTRSSSIQ